ncbi:hypothetical protein GCM10009753_31500 [Streptantibioticus ferralitis]
MAVTPSIRLSFFSIRAAQEAQVIPPISNSASAVFAAMSVAVAATALLVVFAAGGVVIDAHSRMVWRNLTLQTTIYPLGVFRGRHSSRASRSVPGNRLRSWRRGTARSAGMAIVGGEG